MSNLTLTHRLALLGVLLAAVGCVPSEPQWLPDGSGLVYTKPGEKGTGLAHVDLDVGKRRQIATVEDSRTSPVGVSPNGQRYALIQRQIDSGGKLAQVAVFDAEGNNIHTSESFALGDDDFNKQWDAVSWSPHDDRLFLWVMPPRLYHLKTGRFEILPEGRPSLTLLVYRVSPFLPDGTGLLLEVKEPSGGALFFIRDWQGNVQPMKLASGTSAEQFSGQPSEEMKFWPPAGRWQGNIAKLPVKQGFMVLEPDHGEVRFEPSDAVTRAWQKAELDKWGAVATFSDPMQRVVARHLPNDENHFAVEYFSHPGASPTVIMTGVQSGYTTGDGAVTFFPSPAGDLIAIKYRHRDSEVVRLMVIQRRGQILYDGEL